jgi:ketosteroid isomerase-like protein
MTGAGKARILATTIAVTLLTAGASAQTPAFGRVAEGVPSALADYESRLDRGDYAGALEYYADDSRFLWIEHDKIVARSKAEIVTGYEKLKGSAMRITYAAPVVTVLSAEAALVTTGFTAQMGVGAKAAQFSGLLTIVVIKTAAGWRFLIGRA